MKRRTFVLGGLSSVSLLALTACTPTTPEPAPTPTHAMTPTKTAPPPPPHLSQPNMPKPKAFNRTNWSTDPYSRGSQSYLTPGSYPSERDLLATPIDDRVYFAGEATSSALPATVAGAIQTGERVAAELLANTPAGERIAVIGAGIAGATAARLLRNSGYAVTVLEARDRIGGRIDTVPDNGWPIPVERGAGFVSLEEQASIREQLTALGIDFTPVSTERDIRTDSGVSVTPSNVGENAVKKAVTWATTNHAPTSLNIALSQSGATKLPVTPDVAGITPSGWLQYYLDINIATTLGATARELSAQNALSEHPINEKKAIVLGNYQDLVKHRLDGLDVWLSTVVTQISYSDKGVGIRFLTGESLQVDRVAVTVPLGVLKSADISFDPPLPYGHRLAIASIGMGVIDKLWLLFDEPFWDSTDPVWSLVDSTHDFLEWHNLLPTTGKPILVGIVAADRARRLAPLSDGHVVASALESLRPFRAV